MNAPGVPLRSGWSEVADLLGPDTLDAMARPIAEASALPNVCYTSQRWQELEYERLFARSWFVAGFSHEIPEPGDAMPVEAAGMPLLLLRDREGAVRVFHNVCRHRGAVMVAKPCSGLKLLTCPYHAWAYGLDGALRTRPHFHGGDRHDIVKAGEDPPGLVPVRALYGDEVSGIRPLLDPPWICARILWRGIERRLERSVARRPPVHAPAFGAKRIGEAG